MNNKALFIAIVFGIFVSMSLVSAFDFNITIKYRNGTVAEAANVSLEEYDFGFGPPSLNQTHSSLTNANGIAFLYGLSSGENKIYKLKVFVNDSDSITHIGPILHGFPAEMFEVGLSGADMFVEEAIGLNITVYYGDNPDALMARGYDIIDGRFGNHLDFLDMSQNFTDNVVYLPLDATYGFNIYPNDTAPVSVGYGPDECLNSTDVAAGDIISCNINGTVLFVQVYGYINNSLAPFSEFNGINYLVEPGNRVFSEGAFKDLGTLPFPGLSGENDTYNITTGFFNVTVPATSTGFETLLMFFATSGTTNYGAIYNITRELGDDDVAINLSAVPVYGKNDSFSVTDFMGGSTSIVTNLTTFNISQIGGSSGMFSEITVNYPTGKKIKWTFAPSDGSNIIKMPLLNGSSLEANIFAAGAAPKRLTLSSSKLASNSTFVIELRSFERKEGGNDTFDESFLSGIKIEMFNYYNESCKVPKPDDSCSLFSFENATGENVGKEAFKVMLLGKASVRMTDIDTNVSVMYIGVDLMNSNAPPADFGDDPDSDTTSGSTFDEIWSFGSNGPEIYDSAYVTVPYDDSNLNESEDVNVSIDALYDTTSGDSWIVEWNSSVDESGDVANIEHYSEEFDEWSYLLNGTICHTDLDATNVTNPCSIDKINDELNLRIPHFSGTGLNINGQAISSDGGGNNGGGGGGGGASGSGTSTVGRIVTITKDELGRAVTKILVVNDRVRVEIDKINHTITITKIQNNSVTITIESSPQTATFATGETKKFELTRDNYYDIKITLNGINNGSANFTIQSIYEEIPATAQVPPNTTEAVALTTGESKGASGTTSWIIILVILAVVVVYMIYRKYKKSM